MHVYQLRGSLRDEVVNAVFAVVVVVALAKL